MQWLRLSFSKGTSHFPYKFPRLPDVSKFNNPILSFGRDGNCNTNLLWVFQQVDEFMKSTDDDCSFSGTWTSQSQLLFSLHCIISVLFVRSLTLLHACLTKYFVKNILIHFCHLFKMSNTFVFEWPEFVRWCWLNQKHLHGKCIQILKTDNRKPQAGWQPADIFGVEQNHGNF